jgi:hypothetical protein
VLAAHLGQFVVSPLTPGCPVHSCHVTELSVFLAPLVTVQVGSDEPVVPATMQAKTRSLPTVGVALWRLSTPAETDVDVGQAVTAAHLAEEQYQTVF